MTSRLALLCTLLMVAVACGTSQAGISVDYSAHYARPAAIADQSGLHFARSNGDQVSVSRGFLNFGAVEIVTCPSISWLRWLEAFSPISTAHAHTEASPTRLGAPHVLSVLDSPDDLVALGSVHPAPASYCVVRLTLSPADDDADGLPTEVDMVGKTLWLDVTVTPSGGPPSSEIHLESSATTIVDAIIAAQALDGSHERLALSLSLTPEHWLDGVDLQGAAPGDAALTQAATTYTVAVP